jgi:hypothetical protein
MTDPTSRQRGSPTEGGGEGRPVPTETFRQDIMSGHKPRVGLTPRHINCLTVSRNITILYQWIVLWLQAVM